MKYTTVLMWFVVYVFTCHKLKDVMIKLHFHLALILRDSFRKQSLRIKNLWIPQYSQYLFDILCWEKLTDCIFNFVLKCNSIFFLGRGSHILKGMNPSFRMMRTWEIVSSTRIVPLAMHGPPLAEPNVMHFPSLQMHSPHSGG